MRETTEQQIARIKDLLAKLENAIRIGTVTTVDLAKRTVRVSWTATDKQSGDMKVLESGSVCPGGEPCPGGTPWMPKAGDMVVSIHNTSGDGWVIGKL